MTHDGSDHPGSQSPTSSKRIAPATPAQPEANAPHSKSPGDSSAIDAVLEQPQVEPIPGAMDGSLRLTARGMMLEQAALDDDDHPGSGGGDMEFD